MATEYDLTQRMLPFLDPHMAIPLIQFLETDVPAYAKQDLQAAKLKLLSQTKMIDATIELHTELNHSGDEIAALEVQREEVLAQVEEAQEKLKPVYELFENDEALAEIQRKAHKATSLASSLEPYGYSADMPDILFESARLYFDIGEYEDAAQYLYNLRVLDEDENRKFTALWGKLAAEILNCQWDAALADLVLLLGYIDGNKTTLLPLQQLHQRAWLLHWGLFVFFNLEKGPGDIIDFFLKNDACCNALQMTSPYLLRYVAVVAVLTRRERHSVLPDLVRLIRQESSTYSDPILKFITALTVDFNFEEAHRQLKKCDEVFAVDFFINGLRDEFVEFARLYIFEIYCQIHSTISISMLAQQLEMPEDKAEEWIVNLIRKARLDAKIDSTEGVVTMGSKIPNIYHQVLERTKGLSLRTRLMVENLDRQGKPWKNKGRRGK